MARHASFIVVNVILVEWVRLEKAVNDPIYNSAAGAREKRDLSAKLDVLLLDVTQKRKRWRIHWIEQTRFRNAK